MRAKTLCMSAFVALATLGGSAAAKGRVIETLPLDQVKRGQKGYGLTTMQGTSPERFEFEVIGVNRNFLPKMDIILVKSEDPKLAVSGFWQGMSGSPLFIDGKLTCAFSYGFRFNKVAIGGCTPIEYMKKEGFHTKRRLKPSSGVKPEGGRKRIVPKATTSFKDWLKIAPGGDVGAALERLGPTRKPWLMQSPLPSARARTADPAHGMTPSSVPLAMSGFTAPAFEQAKRLMGGFPLEPMAAGGTGSPNAGPTAFTPGGAIAVQLLRGDMSAAATGTVSFVDGDGVLAFGHPMFQAGEIYAPVAAAEIHTVIPSAFSAFIVASPLRELGSLVQDRQSTIAADTGLKVDMIPVSVRIQTHRGGTKGVETFKVEILNNRFFTSTFAAVAAMNAMSLYLPDRDHATVKIRSAVKVAGYEPLRFTDYLYSGSGAQAAVAGARGLRVLVPLLMNPFRPVELESIDLDIAVRYDTNYGDITTLRLPNAELLPGKKSYVDVELERYDGKRASERIPFRVPTKLAGSIVKLKVTSGDNASLDAAPPTNFDQLMSALRKLLPGNVYAVTLETADEGAAIRGKLVKDLPASALDRLRTASKSDDEVSVYRPIARSTYASKRVINGSAEILVKVADLDD